VGVDYKFHYTDTEAVAFRWGKHPHAGDYVNVSGLEHYHPLPTAGSDADEVEESCIRQSLEALVTRAVLKLWRVAYHTDSHAPLSVVKTHHELFRGKRPVVWFSSTEKGLNPSSVIRR